MPKAIAASAKDDPHLSRGESYVGWMAAINNSAITAITTNPAQPHSQRSHEDDAASSWSSVAFIVPFGKRHAGNEFRGFWVGLGVGALMFVLLFGALYLGGG